MKDTLYYLDELAKLDRERGGTGSDYAVAKLLNVSRSRISSYRTRRSGFDDALAMRVADLLGKPPGAVVANIHAARETAPAVRRMWEQVAEQITTAA